MKERERKKLKMRKEEGRHNSTSKGIKDKRCVKTKEKRTKRDWTETEALKKKEIERRNNGRKREGKKENVK